MDAVGFGKLERKALQKDLMVGRVSRLAGGAETTEVESVAREMESLFATMMVAELRKGLGEGFFGGGAGADTFNGWFDEQLGASMASSNSLGLAEQIHESIVRENKAKADEAARKARELESGPESGVKRS